MISNFETGEPLHAGGDDLPELELTDEDILDAMRHILGNLDISTEDFRAIYHLAHMHALDRPTVPAGACRQLGALGDSTVTPRHAPGCCCPATGVASAQEPSRRGR